MKKKTFANLKNGLFYLAENGIDGILINPELPEDFFALSAWRPFHKSLILLFNNSVEQ
jgi:hypothetical protein